MSLPFVVEQQQRKKADTSIAKTSKPDDEAESLRWCSPVQVQRVGNSISSPSQPN